MSNYTRSDMVSIVIPVPKALNNLIEIERKKDGRAKQTKRELYLKALRDFVAMHEGYDRRHVLSDSFIEERRRISSRPGYMATYKNPNAPKLRIWVDRPLADVVTELAKRACVSRRAFAYTAIYTAFQNPQEIKECQEIQ